MIIWDPGKYLKTHFSRFPLCSVCPSAVKNIKKGPSFSYLMSQNSYSSSDPTTREAKKGAQMER